MAQVTSAQIHVDQNGSVGMGTNDNGNNSKLKITWNGLETNQNSYILYLENNINSTATHHYGAFSEVMPGSKIGFGGYFRGNYAGFIGKADGTTCSNVNRYGGAFYAYDGDVNNGVYAKANGPKKNYGVRGYADNGSNWNYGIYGSTGYSGNSRYAGYFQGNVHILGHLTVSGNYPLGSDKKIKENIEPMESVIENIKKMNVKKYNYKDDKKLKLPSGKKYGLTAQDLEKLYPEMVTEISYPYEEMTDDPENPTQNETSEPEIISYKAIYYDQLIPTLIKGMQEQQEMIEKQQVTIDDLKKRVEKLELK